MGVTHTLIVGPCSVVGFLEWRKLSLAAKLVICVCGPEQGFFPSSDARSQSILHGVLFDFAPIFLLTSFHRHVRENAPNVSFFGSTPIFVFVSRP